MADNLDPVIKTLIAEALGEGPEGMRLVAETILNRADKRGMSPTGVVAQPAQYTGYSNPGPSAQRAFNDPIAVAAAQAAWELAQQPGDPTGGATHYWAPQGMPGGRDPYWADSETKAGGRVKIGNHIFLAHNPVPPRDVPGANAVATQLDTRRSVTGSPQTMPASLGAQRQLTAQLSQGQQTVPDASFYNGIYQKQQSGNLTQGNNINRTVQAAQAGQDPALAAALGNYQPKAQTKLPAIPASSSVAPGFFNTSFANAAQAQSPALMAAMGKTGSASKGSMKQPTAAERAALAYVAPSTPKASMKQPTASERAALSYVAQSRGVGSPPSTRSVQSVPYTSNAPIPYNRGETVGTYSTLPAVMASKGMKQPTPGERAALAYVQPKPTAQPNTGQVQAGTGFRVPNLATQPSTVIKGNERLAGGVYPAAPSGSAPSIVAGGSRFPPLPRARPNQVTLPTPIDQRPMMAMMSAGRAAKLAGGMQAGFVPKQVPAMMSNAQPLNVLVQGAQTQQPVQQQQQQIINPSNHDPAQLAAISSGQSTYTPSGGGPSEPVRAMNGNIRYTY